MRRVNKYLIAGLVILGIAMAGHAAGLIAARSLGPRIEKSLGLRLGADVRIQGLEINWITGAHMEAVVMRPAGENQGKCATNGIRLSDVDIDHAIWPLFAGEYRITRIAVADLEACIDARLIDRLLSDERSGASGDRIPGIAIENGTVRFAHPVLDKALEIQNIRVSGESATSLRIRALASFDSGRNFIHADLAADPAGIDAELWVKDFDPASLPCFQIRKGRLCPASLGLEEGISGKLTARYASETGLVTVQSGLFESPAGGLEVFSGGMSFGRSGIGRAWIRAGARGMDLARFNHLARRMSAGDKFQPQLESGRLQGRFYARWAPEAGLDYEAEVSVHNGTVYLPALDRRFHAIEAEADVFSPGRLVIEKCLGRVAGGQIEFTGSVDFEKTQILRHQLRIDLSEIQAGQDMEALLAPPVWRVIEEMQIQQALLDGRIRLAPGDMGVDLRVQAQSARLPDLPFRLQEPATRIRWNSGTKQVSFNEFKAFVEGSPVAGQATLLLGKPLRANFTLLGQYLPITPDMLDWLGLAKPPWKVSGSYDIELRARGWQPGTVSPRDALSSMKVQADLREISLVHPELGQVASNWYGHLGLNDRRIRLTDFTGEVYGIGLHANGSISVNDPGETYLRVESQSITLDDDLYDRLPFGKPLQETGLKGQCELKAELSSEGDQRLPTKGSLAAVIHHAEASVQGIAVGGGGTARIRVSGLGSPDLRLSGNLNLLEAFVDRFEANRLSAEFDYQDDTLRIPDMRMGAYGGIIDFSDSVIHTGNHNWQTRFSPGHMDLESIMAAFGITGRKAPSGSLRGDVRLSGRGWNPEALQGGGEVKISRGRLFEFPIMASVFTVLDLRLPRQSPATDAYVNFRIGDGRLNIRDMLLSGGTVPMHLEGAIGLKRGRKYPQQQVDLLVTTAKSDGLLDQIPLINWVKHYTLDVFRRLAMQVRIKGTLGDYQVHRLSSPVTTPIERMWSLMQKLAPEPPGE